MPYEIRRSPQARKDIRDFLRHLKTEAGGKIARKYLDELDYDLFELIANNPNSFSSSWYQLVLQGHDTHCRNYRSDYARCMARLSRIVLPDIPHHVTQRGNRRQALFREPREPREPLLRGHDTHCTDCRSGYAGTMARLSRIVVPDLPHHVTQRGNRRQALFREPGDYALYRDLLAERCRFNAVACWAYCLMPNHVHLILTPSSLDGLSRAVGEAHRRYTAFVNARARTTGHLFQGRFGCVAMDEAHCLDAVRYLAFNPVRARLAATPAAWPWSSVRAHLRRRDDALVEVRPILALAPRFADLLDLSASEQKALDSFVSASRNGRPLGSPAFIALAERKLGRSLRRAKPGPKPQT